ncbi:MAG: hypothetical protein IH840_17710, partial [Candidatus Heimdallarchaeota archaeon]|nr:hypothetical protein [Candidatus Heimdallarchaeota archaeon]
MDDIEYFRVTAEGDQLKIDGFEAKVDEVYTIVDHVKRYVFLWKGENAPVRLKFIGSRAMGEKRKEWGFHYKIDVNDGGDESTVFKQSLEMEGGDVPSKIGFQEDVGGVPSYAEAAAAQGIDVSDAEVAAKDTRESGGVSQMGGLGMRPQKSILAMMESGEIDEAAIPNATQEKVAIGLQATNIKEAQKMLSELGQPKGYEREMVVIGDAVYRSSGDTDVVFEDLENPLYGLCMVDSYTPR